MALAPGIAPSPVDRRPHLRRLPSLTGLRWLAAFVVFVYHASRQSPTLNLFSDKSVLTAFKSVMQPAGGLGVAFFFVLSGFLLTWSARSGDTARAFWRRRFVKIYPNYVIAWVLAMVLLAAAVTPVSTSVLNLLTLHAWTPGFAHYFSVDPPSWSVGVEMLFYAMFPALLFGIKKIAPDHLKYWIAGTVAAIVAVPAVVYLMLPSSPVIVTGPVSDLQYFFAYIFPPARLFDFALGILVARAVMAGRWRNIGIGASAALLAASYVVAMYTPFLYGQRAVCIVPIALLIAAGASADVAGRRTLFSTRPMVWLGNVSYAFYLIHFIVLLTMRAALGKQLFSTPVAIGILVADFAIAIVIAAFLYHVVETPIVRRFSRPRRPTAVTATTVS